MATNGGDSLACCHQAECGRANPFTKEAANLQSHVAEARWDADKAKKAFEDLLLRSQKDDGEAARVRNE